MLCVPKIKCVSLHFTLVLAYQNSSVTLFHKMEPATGPLFCFSGRCWYQCTLCRKRTLYYKSLSYVNWSLYYMGLSYVLLLIGLFMYEVPYIIWVFFMYMYYYGSILCTCMYTDYCGSYSCTLRFWTYPGSFGLFFSYLNEYETFLPQ